MADDRKPDVVVGLDALMPAEMAVKAENIGVRKADLPFDKVFLLAVLAGAFIGLGAEFATVVTTGTADKVGFGLSKLIGGLVFSLGLILVIVAGAELFTGNNLMITGALGRQYGWTRMFAHWGTVYVANFIGSVLLALIVYESGLWKMAGSAVGAKALAIASAKVSLPFAEAFFRGIGCNWLVCLAVWMALSAKDIAGKILAIFFPIMAFVALGYEHCIANMYFIPMGLFLEGSAAWAGAAPLEVLSKLTWGRFVTANLVPVTLGNIVGGALFVGSIYWFVYTRQAAKKA